LAPLSFSHATTFAIRASAIAAPHTSIPYQKDYYVCSDSETPWLKQNKGYVTRHFADQGAGFLGAFENEMRPFADVVSVLVLQERKQGKAQ